MKALTKRTTVYLDPALHKALRLQSVETSRSVSELINDAVRHELAEDASDLETFNNRLAEPVIEYEVFLRSLKHDGII